MSDVKHMNELDQAVFDDVQDRLVAMRDAMAEAHPDACSGCLTDVLLMALLANLRVGGWEMEDVVETAARVFGVAVVEMGAGGGETPPTVH